MRLFLGFRAISIPFFALACSMAAACGSDSSGGNSAGQGAATSGNTSSGGAFTQGGSTGVGGATNQSGAPAGGATSQGGVPSGGATTGGMTFAGATSGGNSSGGSAGQAQGGSGGTSSGAGGAQGGAAQGGSGGRSGVLRIMAVGDSITRGTCWRAMLWSRLDTNFRGRFEMVGSLNSDSGCAPANYDKDNQGYSSALVTETVDGATASGRVCQPLCPTLNDLRTAFSAQRPDVVLLHFATNDLWNNVAPSRIITAYSAVVDAVRVANPNVIVLVAEIIPMNVTSATCSGCSCGSCPMTVPALNTLIRTWAPTKSTAASPVRAVNQFTGYDAVADNADGVHPNNSGSTKIANNWYTALATLF